jgi:aryl-alcohol dehydrogenase-like predicted oxidoreductase
VIPRQRLAEGYAISRIIKGGWHLAGDHGAIDPARARREMAMFVDAGITTFDCADISTGVEALIGGFRKAYPEHAARVQIHTKFVPDLADLKIVDRAYVERIVDRSLVRLGVERLDLVQFHWWDFGIPGYVETALELVRLQRAGKIAYVGATNFDVPHLRELVEAGVPILTHQVQFSLLDDRPDHGMSAYCRAQGIALLCYGTLAGGFLAERWRGSAAPGPPDGNRSLVKYRLIIDEFGGWELFQQLLEVLAGVADRHGCDIAAVATRAILDRDAVAAAIVGAVDASHLGAHAMVGALQLTDRDLRAIEAVACRRRGPRGDVY